MTEWALTDAKNPSEDELRRLFRAAKKAPLRDRVLIVLAYNGALRVSELLHIKVCHFNWGTGKLTMVPLKKAGLRRKKDGTVIDRPLPKPMETPLPKDILPIVRAYIKTENLPSTSWLFPGHVKSTGCHIVKMECPGGHLSKRKAQLIWDSICRSAGIKVRGRGIHSMKHARLTDVARSEHDPYLVKELGRHESIAMSDRYVKYVDLEKKVKKIGGRS